MTIESDTLKKAIVEIATGRHSETAADQVKDVANSFLAQGGMDNSTALFWLGIYKVGLSLRTLGSNGVKINNNHVIVSKDDQKTLGGIIVETWREHTMALGLSTSLVFLGVIMLASYSLHLTDDTLLPAVLPGALMPVSLPVVSWFGRQIEKASLKKYWQARSGSLAEYILKNDTENGQIMAIAQNLQNRRH